MQGSENIRTQAVISHRIFCNILNKREITRFFFFISFYFLNMISIKIIQTYALAACIISHGVVVY